MTTRQIDDLVEKYRVYHLEILADIELGKRLKLHLRELLLLMRNLKLLASVADNGSEPLDDYIIFLEELISLLQAVIYKP